MKKRNELLIILLCIISCITTYATGRDSLAHLLANNESDKLVLERSFSFLKKKEIPMLNIPARPLFEPTEITEVLATSSDEVEKILFQKLQQPPKVNNDPPDDVRSSVGGLLDDELKAIARARKVIKGLTEAGNFISTLTGADLVKLPVGIKQESNNITYILGIGDIKLKANYAELEVYLSIETPQFEEPLIFGSSDVKFSKEGGIVGGARLGLLGDFPIDIKEGKSIIILKSFDGNGGCYADVDCDGLLGLGVEADVVFSRDWIKPTDAQGMVLPYPNRVQGNFAIELENWEDLIVDVSLPDFVINGVDDVSFSLDKAIFDFSSTTTKGEVVFPANYDSPFADDMGKPTASWEGFFMNQLKVTLPEQFSKNGGARIQAVMHNLIIDDGGVSTLFKLNNLLPIDEGNIGGWAFSIDTFKLDVVRNQFREAGLVGALEVPLFSEEDEAGNHVNNPQNNFLYSADINPGSEYVFSINPVVDHEYPIKLLKAKATIKSTSVLTLEYTEGEFVATATLNGHLAIDGEMKEGKRLTVPPVEFNNFIVSNQKNYIKNIGTWGKPDTVGVSFGAFKLVISDMGIDNGPEEGELEMKLDTKVILAGGKGVDIAAEGKFRIIGEVDDTAEKHNWKYKNLKIDELLVEADAPGFYLKGRVVWFEEAPTYGNGFRGDAELKIKGVNKEGDKGVGTNIAAMALFGSVGEGDAGYRYFFVDAFAKFGAGIPLGGVSLKALGGGVYHHMSREDHLIPMSGAKTGKPSLPTLGTSLSGINYLPDESTRLGLKATVILAAAGDEKKFNLNSTFYITFENPNADGSGGGLGRIGLEGVVNFMAPISWDEEPPCEGIGVKVDMEYIHQVSEDQKGKGFYALMDVYMDINGGKIKGNNLTSPNTNLKCNGINNYAGSVEIQFSDDWFINMGEPDNRISLFIAIPKLKNSEGVGVNAYFDIGNKIPAFPGLPDNVSSLTGLGNILSNESRRATGNGFALGAGLTVNVDKTFLIFYGKFDLMGGFDIMLQKYDNAICSNTGEELGIKGWYGAGQAYAYLAGELGVDLKLFAVKKRFPVIEAGIAVALQAKLPNPVLMRGGVGVHYNVLGGLVKGKMNFQFSVGSSCEFDEDGEDFANQEFITTLLPGADLTDVPVTTPGEVYFSMPVNEIVADNTTEYKLDFQQSDVSLTVVETGEVLEGFMSLDEYRIGATFVNKNLLPGDTKLQLTAKVHIKKKEGNIWTLVETQEKSITFTTGPAFDVIPAENVLAGYPMDGQFNFHPEEASGIGYLLLKSGQSDLFEQVTDAASLKVRFYEEGATEFSEETTFTYNEAQKKLTYSPPSLVADKVYKGTFVIATGAVDGLGYLAPSESNESIKSTTLLASIEEGAWMESVNEAAENDHVLYTFYFRVSQYPTFKDKLMALSGSDLDLLLGNLKLDGLNEPIDDLEIIGDENIDPLIQFDASEILNTTWYQQEISGALKLYEQIELLKFYKNSYYDASSGKRYGIDRDPKFFGTPPVKSAHFLPRDFTVNIEEAYFDEGVPDLSSKSTFVRYEIFHAMESDFKDIYQDVIYMINEANSGGDTTDGSPPNYLDHFDYMDDILYDSANQERGLNGFSKPPFGNYPLKVSYSLPGSTSITTNYTLQLNHTQLKY